MYAIHSPSTSYDAQYKVQQRNPMYDTHPTWGHAMLRNCGIVKRLAAFADWRLPCCTLHVLLQLVHGIARASRRAFSNMRLSSTVASQTVGRSFSPAAHGAQREDAKVINADWRMWHFTHTVTHQRTKHPRAYRTRPRRRAPAILSNSKAIGFRRVAESSSAARVCKTTQARGVETRPDGPVPRARSV